MIKLILYVEDDNINNIAEAMQYASEKVSEEIPYYTENNECSGYFEYASTIETDDFDSVLSSLIRARSAPEKSVLDKP
jgi:hypothetical protein